MADQEWIRPVQPQESNGTAWAGRSEARFELRPLSLGEVLDRTFSLYRSRFWLFAGIAMIAAAVHVIGLSISYTAIHKIARTGALTPATSPMAAIVNLGNRGTASLGSYAVTLVYFLVTSVTQAATALAVTRVYLGHQVGAELALRIVGPRWYRWIGIQLWKLGSFLWVPMAAAIPGAILVGFFVRSGNTVLVGLGGLLVALAILGGVPVGVILYLRNALAIPAAVTEGLSIRPAMRRSKVLAAGSKGRIFVVVLLAYALLQIVAILQTPISLLLLFAPNHAHYLASGAGLLIAFLGQTVVSPVGEIGMTLLYFDQRVKKEALDLELLLDSARGGVVAATEARGRSLPPEGYAPEV